VFLFSTRLTFAYEILFALGFAFLQPFVRAVSILSGNFTMNAFGWRANAFIAALSAA